MTGKGRNRKLRWAGSSSRLGKFVDCLLNLHYDNCRLFFPDFTCLYLVITTGRCSVAAVSLSGAAPYLSKTTRSPGVGQASNHLSPTRSACFPLPLGYLHCKSITGNIVGERQDQ